MQIETAPLDLTERLYWEAFCKTYPDPDDSRRLLAAHAAFPVALTPDLLYKIWLNFRGKDQSGTDRLTALADVSDLLHSALCREIGRDLYEIHPNLRSALLEALQNDPRFGPSHLNKLAHFIRDYLAYNPEKLPNTAFREAQEVTALSYINPKAVAERILTLLEMEVKGQKSKHKVDYLLRLAKQRKRSLANQDDLSDALNVVERIVEGFRAFQSGDTNAALERFRPLESMMDEVGAKGFKAKIPKEVWKVLKPTQIMLEPEENLALQLIRNNIEKHQRGEDATYLDLGNCGLVEVPEEIGELVWLEELTLSNSWDEWEIGKLESKKSRKNLGIQPNPI